MTSPHLEPHEVELASHGDLDRLSPTARGHLDRCAPCRHAVEEAQDQELPTRRDRAAAERSLRSQRSVRPVPSATSATGANRTAEAPPDPAGEEGDGATELEVKRRARPTGEDTGTRGGEDLLDRGASVGRYIVLGPLGQGGMGVVYAAYDAELDRKVAIKLLKGRGKEGQARLMREAQAMARISHPNVISVYDVGTLGDRVFVAMEFIDGATLRKWLKDEARGWREVLEVFVAAGRGLSAAHAAGLVHRDFKPENVLIGNDGRVCVTDFGLARLAGEPAEQTPPGKKKAPPPSRQLLSPLTQEGHVVGTPHYMAPEQFQGRPPDTRTDQFAFCAALYWALWRKRPFDPQKLADVAADLDEQPTTARPQSRSWTGRRPDGVIQEPPSKPRVPSWVRRAVLQGLSLDPADRCATMDELLAGLSRHPARQRHFVVAGGALVAAVLLAVVWSVQASRAAVCSGGQKMMAGVWDERIRGAVEKAFTGSGVLEASQHYLRASGALDTYAQQWVAGHREACEATRIRREQTEDALSLRMMCLDRRLRELRSLTGLFAAADAKLVNQAVDAVLQLPSVRHCADVEALAEPVPRPTDPAVRRTIDEVTDHIAEASALRYAGQYPRALEKARLAWDKARTVNFKPVEAEALFLRGWLEDRTGKVKDAEETLVASLFLADAGRDDRIRAQAAMRLLYSMSQQLRIAEGHRWAEQARAAIERLGGNRELEADLLSMQGSLYLGEGRYDEAVLAYERALKLIELEYGREHYKRSNNLSNLGTALLLQKRDEKRAVATLTEAVALTEKLRGPDHPTLAVPLYSLAEAQGDLGQFDRAHAHLARALSIARARFGPAHPRVAGYLDLQGTLYQTEGRFHEALGAYQAALEIKKKALPADSPDLSYSYDGVGQALLGLGKPQEALPILEKALKLRGPEPEGLAETRFGLARALWELGRDRARARGLALQARADYEKAKDQKKAEEIAQWIAAR